MISEEDAGNYMNKYPQETGCCQVEDVPVEFPYETQGALMSQPMRHRNGSKSDRKQMDVNLPTSNGKVLEGKCTEQMMKNIPKNLTAEEIIARKPILEQDRFLPIANISRLMKNVIPRSGKVAKDAKECVQECVSEFISFITSEACDRCLNEKRKTITGEDIISAFVALGFDNYVEPLSTYVKKFREAFRTERSNENLAESMGSHSSVYDKMNPHRVTGSVSSADTYAVHDEPISSSSSCAPQVIFAGEENPDGSVRVLSAGNVQHLQLLMDPATGQHYINVQGPNGTQQLLPVQVTAVGDSSNASSTVSCPEAQSHIGPEKEVTQVGQHSDGPIRSGITYEIGLKPGSSGHPPANQQHKQMTFNSGIGQLGVARENSRKRSHESINYISFD